MLKISSTRLLGIINTEHFALVFCNYVYKIERDDG